MERWTVKIGEDQIAARSAHPAALHGSGRDAGNDGGGCLGIQWIDLLHPDVR